MMAAGRQKAARGLAVAQAALVWAADKMDLAEFVETGRFESPEAKIERDPVVREAMHAALEGRGEEFVNALIRKDMAERAAAAEAAKGTVDGQPR